MTGAGRWQVTQQWRCSIRTDRNLSQNLSQQKFRLDISGKIILLNLQVPCDKPRGPFHFFESCSTKGLATTQHGFVLARQANPPTILS